MRGIVKLLLIVAFLAAGPAEALFSLLNFKNAMVEFLIDQLSTKGEFEITVEEVDEPAEGVTSIRGLAIADANGIWFRAGQLNFSWNPSRLLNGEVEFSNLAMQDVEVLRQPVIPPGDEAEAGQADGDASPFAWPRSPLTIRIERMALERVRIAEPVLGHAIAFDAEGAARDEGDVQAVRLTLTRSDAIRGSIAFDYARNFADNTLAVNLKATEAPGGLIADLGGLPAGSPSDLTIRAEGPPTDWRMVFELALADLVAATGRAKISYQGPIRVDASFTARPGDKLAPDIATLLGEEARLVVKAAEGPDGTILIENARLTSPDLMLAVAGRYERPTGAADLSVELTAGGRLAQPIDGVDFKAFGFTGHVQGQPGAMSAKGELKLEGLRTAPVDVDAAALTIVVGQSGPTSAPTTRLDATGKIRGLRLDRIAAGVIGDASLEIVGSLAGDTLLLEVARLENGLLAIGAAGAVDFATGDLELTFDLAAPEMAPVAAAYGIEARGGIRMAGAVRQTGDALGLEATADLVNFTHPLADAGRLHLSGKVERMRGTTRFDLTGNGTGLRIDRIEPDLIGRADLAASGSLTGDTLHLTRARIASALLAVSAEGKISLAGDGAALRYDIAMPDLGPLTTRYDVPLTGAFKAEGAAELPADGGAARLVGDVRIADLSWRGERHGDVGLNHDVELAATPAGTISLSLANGRYAPARISTAFAYTGRQLSLDDLAVSAIGIRASGKLDVMLDNTLVEGALALRADDLAPLGRLAGTRLGGRASGKLRLSTPGGRQNADLTLDATGLSTGGIGIAKARIRAALRDLLGTPGVDARADLSGIDAGTARLATVGLTARGPLARLDVGARLSGKAAGKPLSASLAARVSAAGNAIRARISQLEATLANDRFALARPLGMTINGATISLRGLDLELPDGGRLSGDLTRHGGPLSGDLRLNVPRLAFLKRLAGIPVTGGSIEAEASFDTRRARAQASVRGRALAFEDVDAAGALDVDATLDWKGRSARIDASVSGDFGEPMRLEATLPMRAGGALPRLARRGRVDGKLRWKGEIGNLWALVPAPGHVLSGATTVDIGYLRSADHRGHQGPRRWLPEPRSGHDPDPPDNRHEPGARW